MPQSPRRTRPCMAPSSDGFPVNMCPAHSKIVAYKHGQNAANALENTIFTAAAGDLPAYQQIFRRIYLDLKTQTAVAQLFEDPTARFFWPSVNHFQEEPGLENVVRPGYALLVDEKRTRELRPYSLADHSPKTDDNSQLLSIAWDTLRIPV
ncbi:hypothetical protein B0H14DRAFT_2567775 [Mycena olivaceomarginata]|nr:hypothetical protein B0H14DRAFT_2567775 [Mycena olivaceomarginata]